MNIWFYTPNHIEVSYLNNNWCHLSKSNAVASGKKSIENTITDAISTSFKRPVSGHQVDAREKFFPRTYWSIIRNVH